MKKSKLTLLILPLLALTSCGKKVTTTPPIDSNTSGGSSVVVPDNSTPSPTTDPNPSTNPGPDSTNPITDTALAVYQFNQLDAEVTGGDFNISANTDLQAEIFDTFSPNIITNATKVGETTFVYYKAADATFNSPLKLGKGSPNHTGEITFSTTTAVSKIVVRGAAWHKKTSEITVNGVIKSVTTDHASPFVASDYQDMVFEFDATTSHSLAWSERAVITTISLYA